MEVPKVFISYSHDTLDHKKWVLELAIRLRNNGIDAIIDQFELQAGDDVPHFMETSLAKADKIIMICTERYVNKANNGEGGVGYEKMIVTSNLLKRIDENKVIPIIRQNGETKLPTFLSSKLYINFSKNDEYEFNFDNLLRTIHKTPIFEKPPIGNNPFKEVPKESLNGDIKLINETLKTIANLQGISHFTESIRVSQILQISPVMFKVIGIKLNTLGYTKWVNGNSYITITDKGLMYAYENNLIS
ncbi:toll/interleukin-1 receptor domain-containing protein [Flavobacterium sp. I-SCBP12n]|uniref:Toll/interleukin-1 receptor domain-containing protein n=1 Tax=Flavobacterium pygoscelis TaxID=2893176 RepID=A0A9X1XUB6_9FLAO|nr:toll/interleukin-1 receptor domain-containing protein [Flavobacterium pygoscelis]MCK8143372.1 toll/interleukin-1 receptor domain-containing protein [Flavobacterium pygoscelis]